MIFSQSVKEKLEKENKKIHDQFGLVHRIEAQLSTEQQKLRAEVKKYNSNRLAAFHQALEDNNHIFCTECQEIVAKNKSIYLFTRGTERKDGAAGCYGYVNFSRLVRACIKCANKILARQGTVGTYDTAAKNQEIFHAFPVEERKDGYYYIHFGEERKVSDSAIEEMPEPNPRVVAALGESLGIPPEIWVDSSGNLQEKKADASKAA